MIFRYFCKSITYCKKTIVSLVFENNNNFKLYVYYDSQTIRAN